VLVNGKRAVVCVGGVLMLLLALLVALAFGRDAQAGTGRAARCWIN
jgi:hypothetical protein